MAIASDLMGLGLPGPLAQYLSFNNLAVTTTGTATTGGQNLAQNKTAVYFRVSANVWVSILTA